MEIILDIVPRVVHKRVVKSQDLIPVSFYKTDSGNEPVREWLLEGVTEEEKK
jgi:hypothetical protein